MKILSLSLTLFSGMMIGMHLQSCAKGSKPIPRKFQKKLYRFCQDFETSKPIGKLCNRVKVKKKFVSKTYDLTNPDTFKKFRAANIVCINESDIL